MTISADPTSIQLGESATLHWTSINANSVTIDQGIDQQPPTGQVTISPGTTTTYTIVAQGPGGTASASVQITVTGELIITLLEPLDQQTVASKKNLVHGRLATNAPFANVQINEKRAVVENKEFFLNDLQVPPGNFEIMVEASDSNRSHAVKSIFVVGVVDETDIELTIGDPVGIIPFNTQLQARLTSGELLPGSALVSWTGPGDVTVSKINDSEFTMGFTQAGLYTITYTAKDSSGLEYTAQQMIAAREPMREEEWQNMSSAVRQLENLYLTQVGSTNIDTLRQQIVELARANPDSSSVKLSSDSLCLIYKGRIPIVLDLLDPQSKPKD